jgi:hypothetical protein
MNPDGRFARTLPNSQLTCDELTWGVHQSTMGKT